MRLEIDGPWQEIRWAALGTGCAFQLAVAVNVLIDGFADGENWRSLPGVPEFVGSVTVRITSACALMLSVVTYIG